MSATDVNPFGLTKINRDKLPKGGNLCEYCTAKCCKYFALPIDIPETFEELEYIRWYLLHDRASVFKEEDDWYLLVHTTCEHLLADNRCGIYETRPQICRDHSNDGCEFEGPSGHEDFDIFFPDYESLLDYCRKKFKNWDGRLKNAPGKNKKK